MSDHTSTHENAIGPGLVNQPLFFRKVLPRLYKGTVAEILGELFQNSNRAGADMVELTILAPGRFTYRDNGSGLLQGTEGFLHLLCIANSSWEDEAVEPNQQPIGLGFFALIVHQRVRSVRVESNGTALVIDTQLFINDEEYQRTWYQRLEKQPFNGESGFFLLVEGDAQLTEEVEAQLRRPDPTPYEYWVQGKPFGPARGYSGSLSIILNGEPVETRLPSWFVLPRADIVDAYLGNTIRIALSESDVVRPAPPEFSLGFYEPSTESDSDRSGLRILWFGQPISDRGIFSVRVFLDVRAGAPVTPQAPTRQALVQDGKLADLYDWVRDRVFRYICHEAPSPTAAQVDLLFSLDRARAERECPWALLRPRRGLPPQPALSQEQQIRSYYDLETLTVGHDRAVRRETLGDLLLLDEQVVVLLPGTHPVFKDPHTGKLPEDATAAPRPFTFEYGLSSFLALLDIEVYQPKLGASPTGVLWWKPGEPKSEYCAGDLGWWGIGSEDEPPREWRSVPPGSVLFVHDEIDSWGIGNVRIFVGVEGERGLIDFLEAYSRVFWYEDEEEDGSEESYDESVDELIRSLLGNTIARQAVQDLIWAVQSTFSEAERPVTIRAVDLLRKNDGVLTGIRVHLKSGQTKELALY